MIGAGILHAYESLGMDRFLREHVERFLGNAGIPTVV